MTTITAADLIAQSIHYDEIVHAEYTEALELDLLVACEDSADAGDETEYWGTTESGDDWRVHLIRTEAE